MSDSLRPGGFPENTPEVQALEHAFRGVITGVFKSFGFIGIETPAVEKTSVLIAKGGDEVSKQIFGLYGLAQGASDAKPYSLRFDLTVPLARYVLDHESEIRFPFKRYHIDKVWRGERQQKGRFKEFYQCDVDVIDENLDINYDTEVITVLYLALSKIFQEFKIPKEIEVHINNKKFIELLFDELGIEATEQRSMLYKLFDDFYKIPYEDFEKRLMGILGEDRGQELLGVVQRMRGNDQESFSFEAIGSSLKDEKTKEALAEIQFIYSNLSRRGVPVKFDPFIMRGLDYYSGTVFETFISGHDDFGSICSGGRYDELVGSIRDKHTNSKSARIKKYGGVGGSIGLSRLLSRLMDAGFLNSKTLPLVQTLVFNLNNQSIEYREQVAQLLRSGGVSAEVYYGDDKLKKQFDYAASKNIPLGVFVGGEEESSSTVTVKDLVSKESTQVSLGELLAHVHYKLHSIF